MLSGNEIDPRATQMRAGVFSRERKQSNPLVTEYTVRDRQDRWVEEGFRKAESGRQAMGGRRNQVGFWHRTLNSVSKVA